MKEKINVTQTFLPSQKGYQNILSRSWNKKWITNRGELVLELESKISNMLATTNGTLPLQIAIKSLGLTGEIVTTPFSYIATASSIFWEGCTPVFADIDPETLNINAKDIEAVITPKTTAILATHVFGNPCDIEAIEHIAKKHELKVIYDAAHCFGVSYNGKSIFEYGDVSTCSFHATKIFHTGEGGALFTKSEELYKKMYYHHNFGHEGSEKFHGLGINAKMSELQGAMGLAVFPYFDDIFKRRATLYQLYVQLLSENENISFQKIMENTDYNHSYIPIILKTEAQLKAIIEGLNSVNVFPRRYFYPSLNTIEYLEGKEMKNSEFISKRIICLPLYHNLEESDVVMICENILNIL